MTTHKHTIARNATSTGTVTDPDLSVYAKAADLKALAARVLALENAQPPVTPPVTPPPVPPPAGTPPADLQSAINAASPGATINATGGTYSGSFTINKALTLIGGTINFPAGSAGLTVAANGVTLDGVRVLGPGVPTAFNGNERAIYVNGSSGSRIAGLVVKNCEVGNSSGYGMLLRYVSGAVVSHNSVHDCAFVGIAEYSGLNGLIEYNTVARIGYGGVTGLPGSPSENDAYGIDLEFQSGDVPTDGTVVDHNTVTDVPLWHGIDTHSGQNVTFSNNTLLRVSRGMFITTESYGGYHATNVKVLNNQFLSPSPVTFNLVPLTLVAVHGITVTGNSFVGWGGNSPTPSVPYYDYQNQSTSIVNGGGNVVTP